MAPHFKNDSSIYHELMHLSELIPTIYSLLLSKLSLNGEYGRIMPELVWVIGYAVALTALAIIAFTKKMNSDNP